MGGEDCEDVLDSEQTNITVYGVISILQSEYLTNLTTLDLEFTDPGNCEITNLEGLTQHSSISSVTCLDLSYFMSGYELISMLVKCPLLMNLRTLNLSYCNYAVLNLISLLQSPYITNITDLN